MNPLVPVHRHRAEIQVGFANRLQNLGYLTAARQKQMPILERLQSRTHVKARSVRQGHSVARVEMSPLWASTRVIWW
jgi:hypothetical protein